MRVAVILENIYVMIIGSDTRKALLFDVENEVVIALDEEIISLSDINYLSLWLLGKRVERLYCDDLDAGEREFIEKTGIAVWPLNAIRDHPILQALLLKDRETGDKES